MECMLTMIIFKERNMTMKKTNTAIRERKATMKQGKSLTNEELKREAMVRMMILGMDEWIIREFEKNDSLACTDRNGETRILTEEEAKRAREYADACGKYIFHAVKDESGGNLYLEIERDVDEEYMESERAGMRGLPVAYALIEDLSKNPYSDGIACVIFEDDGSYTIDK